MIAPTNHRTQSTTSLANRDGTKLEDFFERYKAKSSKNLSSSRRRSSTSSTSSSTSDMTSDSTADLKLAAAFITKEQFRLERRGKALLKEVIEFSEADIASSSATKVAEFKEQAQDIVSASIKINRFAVQSTKAYINEQSAQSKSSTALVSKTPWTYIAGGTKIVTILSDVYDLTRSIEKDGIANKGGDQWVAPSSFERSTHKYWVDEDFLSDVMLSCVSEVPMLVYGKSGLLTDDLNHDMDRKASKANMKDIWQAMTTPITSIYFDSPDMYLYGHRIARDEGAKLFRVRWYGEKPAGDDLLFLELKTHHEQWIADKSVKQRVSLRERDMSKLLARDGAKWDRAFTEELVLLANPKLEGDELHEATRLLSQIRKLVIKKDLRPCVRTRYLRMAFQSAKSNTLRLTIDRDITMIDESTAPLGNWSLPEDVIKNAEAVRVPCAVFEVKLAGSDNPAFMEELLQNGALQDGHKFSKFLTGAATFHADKVNILPYWATLPMFKGMFGIADYESSVPLSDKIPSKATRRHSPSTTSTDSESVSLPASLEPSSSDSFQPASLKPTSSDSFQPVRRGSALSLLSFGRRSSDSASSNLLGSKKVAPKKRARVEPKTYFASERTYIQWISAALLLVTIATLLLGISTEEGLDAARVMSLTLIFTALFIAIYAVFIYFRRLHLLTNGLPYGYADHAGPVILTAAVLMGIIALLYYTFTLDTSQVETSRVATVDSSGKCKRHSFSGISLLEYQPSDMVIEETSQTMIIPSQSKLTGIPLAGQGEQEVSILGEVPGADIEAVAYAHGMLYAVAEGKGSSTLMSFEPRYDGEHTRYDLVGQWKLKGRALTEGMAYVPDENGGKLYISDITTDTLAPVSNVYVYDIPVPSVGGAEDEIFPVHQLNGKMLSFGISETPKIGAMTYFEDVLYLLHDNARVVRGWDLKSGTMVSEWILPRVEGEGGFDQQWEGMSLQRGPSAERNMFRGAAKSSSVVLHLALDTPPQIWSFQLEEIAGATLEKSSYALPECAAAF